jgi:hypothetical protein
LPERRLEIAHVLHECSPAANAGKLPALTIGASGMMRSASHQYPEMRNAPQWRNCEALNLVSAVLRHSRNPPGEAALWFQR